MLYDHLKGILVRARWHLSQEDFFRDIPEVRQAFLARTVRRDLRKGDYAFHEGDSADACFYLERGVVRIYRVTAEGKEPIFFLRRAGDMFGLAEVVAGADRKCSAQAITPCILHQLDRAGFEQLLDGSPVLARRIIALLGRRLRFLGEQVESLMSCDVSTRILKILVYLAYDRLADGLDLESPVSIPFALTQEQIASMAGSCQQTVSETMKKLQADGLIQVTRKAITILRPAEVLERID
jgi:CRP-like cAMP-binding protein